MKRNQHTEDGWRAVVGPLADLVDLEVTVREQKALLRRREIKSAEELLRLAVAWGPGGLSLRQASAWAGISGIGDFCDSALLKRLRNSANWLETLVQAVLLARAPAAETLAAEGRLVRLVDGSTFGVVGSDRPGWRLHAGFDVPTGRFGQITLTSVAEGENLERIPVVPGELRVADRGFARPDGLRHMVSQGGHFLVRIGSRSLKLEDAQGRPVDLASVFDAVARDGSYDGDVLVRHGRKGRKKWPPLPVRLVVRPLPAGAEDAARRRLDRAGQREGYKPSSLAQVAAGHMMLVTSLGRDQVDAEGLTGLYRLRWQVELAFKRLKSLLDMRRAPCKDPDLARTWLYSHLLVALLAEDFSADLGDSPP